MMIYFLEWIQKIQFLMKILITGVFPNTEKLYISPFTSDFMGLVDHALILLYGVPPLDQVKCHHLI